jgi:sarcosine oxidase subunit gamma
VAEVFEPTRYSPLSGLRTPAGGVEMAERPYVGKVNLRGDPEDRKFRAAAEQQLGLELPVAPNTWTSNEDFTVYWLGPDEWAIYCRDGQQSATIDNLRRALDGSHAALTDVSDYYLVIRLTGDKARELLSKGTPLDVHPTVLGPGMCAQTCFGHATILLSCLDDAPTFDIQIRWSFAEYLWNFLVGGTVEYEQS